MADLLTPYRFTIGGKHVEKKFVGGLLGHWAVWTSEAVKLLNEIKGSTNSITRELVDLLSKGAAVTDMNEVIFDARNSFRGCIPGIHEVLRRQGLLQGRWCLDSHEELSPHQSDEINRIYEMYPHLNDDAFVKAFLISDQANNANSARGITM